MALRRRLTASITTLALLASATLPAIAEGFLVGRTERLPDIEVALGNAGYGVSKHEYNLTTGKGYRLWIKSTGNKPCAFSAPEFFENVWFRKIEVNKVELKFTHVTEIEFEDEGAAELFFTPIKPGEYTWVCDGLEQKGMTGKIVVK